MKALDAFPLVLLILCVSGCRTNVTAEEKKAEIELSLIFNLKGTDLAIGAEGPLLRDHPELSKYSDSLMRQSVVNGQTYRTVFIGGELNDQTHSFDVVLLEFKVSDAPIDGIRQLYLNTKLTCKINIVPEDFAQLKSSETVPDDNLFQPGKYFLQLETK